jgi:hypothetical protein
VKSALIAVIVCLCITAPVAWGASQITSANIRNETLSALDMGTNVTSVKSVPFTQPPSDDDWDCDRPDVDDVCVPKPGSGAGVQKRVVTCATGNVASGGVDPDNPNDGFNLEVYASYPSAENQWTFALHNSGPDTIKGHLRVVCI